MAPVATNHPHLPPQLWLCLLPLGPPPRWFQAFAAHATRCFNEYFEVSVITEAEAALQQGQPYLVALEPHSVLPFAMPGVFQSGNQLAPRALSRCHGLASSVVGGRRLRCLHGTVLWWSMGL